MSAGTGYVAAQAGEAAPPVPQTEGPAHPAPQDGPWDGDAFDDVAEEDAFATHPGLPPWDRLGAGPHPVMIYASQSNINAGSLHGDQRAVNSGGAGESGGRYVEVREGPVSAGEAHDALVGFAEPRWFDAALTTLDDHVTFLVGEPGTGRRTAALNLLSRRAAPEPEVWAVDSDTDLAAWRPPQVRGRGYLVDGLLPSRLPGPAALGRLRRWLAEDGAHLVIVLREDPGVLRALEHDLHVRPVRCTPAPPHAVFDARFRAAVPGADERQRLVAALEPGFLDTLLSASLTPAEVAELVATVIAADGGPTATDDIRDRLSFLAENEVPDLLTVLREDPDGLAFLLAACVFEGLDHRIVREEAQRLLDLADGRLDAVLPPPEGGGDAASQPGPPRPRPNPGFALRRSLDEQLRTVRARRAPRQVVRAPGGYTYAVEPVWLTRHQQGEAVLRHVWRQYGQAAGLLTEWLNETSRDADLVQPVGRLMGLAAQWGGGRRALAHIRTLAWSDRDTSRRIAAAALGIAASEPVLASEVKHHVEAWGRQRQGWQARCTVAHACGGAYGLTRPAHAMRLLHHVLVRTGDAPEHTVRRAVRQALGALFDAGHPATVFRHLTSWAAEPGPPADLAMTVLPTLLRRGAWWCEQLLDGGECAADIVDLTRRALGDDDLFARTASAVVSWCRPGFADDRQHEAARVLLTALAQRWEHGVLRLFVVLDQDPEPDLAARDLVRAALDSWRHGRTPSSTLPSPTGSAP
ncbi:hypothetical protein JJV70_20200 [Streptomyces sp. JJ66]|uniref:hypothetical protein n=1 Tax=Streptomyces sp. JJ66 TaxID=2803843 RepID=UPI001C581374|nr:hypothetical protein [Streptomyces sp. JJ66]MBW1604381.1 hypothetical protein [Streptomyces sp. JJ66]